MPVMGLIKEGKRVQCIDTKDHQRIMQVENPFRLLRFKKNVRYAKLLLKNAVVCVERCFIAARNIRKLIGIQDTK